MPRICVVHTQFNLNKDVVTSLSHYSGFIAFGESPASVERFEQVMGGMLPRISCQAQVEALYPEVSKAFSEAIAELIPSYGNESYFWNSPIVEKNGWPCNHVVSRVLLEILKDFHQEGIVLLTSNPLFGLWLGEHTEADVTVIGKGLFRREHVLKYLRTVPDFGYKLIRSCKEAVLAKALLGEWKQPLQDKKIAFMRDFVNEKKFKGKYKPMKLETLDEYYESAGYQVVYSISIMGIRNLRPFFKLLASSEERIFVHERYISMTDILCGIREAFRHFSFMHRLGAEYILPSRHFCMGDVFENYLKALIPEKLYCLGIKPDIAVINWENKAYEKAMIKNLERRFPETLIVGYISAILFPTGPECSSSPTELKETPLPHRIVTIGKHSSDMLLRFGCPKERIFEGPLLRHRYIYDDPAPPVALGTVDDTGPVLVCFPMSLDISRELLRVILDYADQRPELPQRIVLKLHPFAGLDRFPWVREELLKLKAVRISQGTLDEEIDACRLFIYCGPTTAACEALAKGKSVARYISKNFYSMDCLYGLPDETVKSFAGPEDLDGLFRSPKDINANSEPLKNYIFERNGDYRIFLKETYDDR